jgi:hypothetical protein
MRFMKSMAAGLALLIGAVSFTGTAQADRWRGYGYYNHGANYRYHHRGYYPRYYRGHRYRYDRDYYNGGAAVAAGVLGFATGAIVGSAAAAPRYYAPRYYGAPARYSGATSGTAAWIAACDAKYNSFNPRTGTYLGYDGEYHRCQLP